MGKQNRLIDSRLVLHRPAPETGLSQHIAGVVNTGREIDLVLSVSDAYVRYEMVVSLQRFAERTSSTRWLVRNSALAFAWAVRGIHISTCNMHSTHRSEIASWR